MLNTVLKMFGTNYHRMWLMCKYPPESYADNGILPSRKEVFLRRIILFFRACAIVTLLVVIAHPDLALRNMEYTSADAKAAGAMQQAMQTPYFPLDPDIAQWNPYLFGGMPHPTTYTYSFYLPNVALEALPYRNTPYPGGTMMAGWIVDFFDSKAPEFVLTSIFASCMLASIKWRRNA